MNHSPISSSVSTSSSSSSLSNSTLQPSYGLSTTLRRRSVDTGGLNLVINDHDGSGSGRGYGGWVEHTQALPGSIEVAELVIAMRQQTNSVIDQAYPATNETFRPSSETDAQRDKYIRKLATWHFDASHSPPDELLTCTTLLFELLWTIEGMEEDIGLAYDTIPPFLARVSKIYREQTSYHNFQHALDVLQAVYCYLYEAGCIPCVEILLDQEQEAVTAPSQIDSGKGKGRAQPAADVGLPTPRCRKSWRRPRPGSTLLQRALRNQDLFALFVAAIGHDIGHPGLSNAFMKNAKTPLAELFDDTSVLEKMHCTLLLQVMRKHRMGHLLDRLPSLLTHETGFLSVSQSRARTESDPGVLNRDIHGVFSDRNGNVADLARPLTPPTPSPPRPILKKSVSAYHGSSESTSKGTGTEFRNLLVKTILSTDMSVHYQWMSKFEQLLHRLNQNTESEAGDDFGKDGDSHTRLLLCQALIKCADISNPSRPPPTCKYWSWSLLTEWAEQALLEEQLSLPISVSASDDPIEAAQGQITFISMFTQPLLNLTSSIIPEMEVFGKQCEENVAMWQAKINELHARTVVDDASSLDLTPPSSNSNTSSPLALPTSPPDVSTMFALSLPAALYTPNSETRQPSWPVSSTSTPPPLSMPTRPEMSDMVHINGRLNGTTSPDSIPPSPPSGTAAVPRGSHRRHPPHTELPQVSIPTAHSASFSPFTSQHAKSSSTTTSTSPLFSPRSITTSSSSPRSDISNSLGPSAVTHTLGLPFRPALRAAYDAHGRPKAMKRLENRTSWQGSVKPSSAPASSDWTGTAFNQTLSRHADHGS